MSGRCVGKVDGEDTAGGRDQRDLPERGGECREQFLSILRGETRGIKFSGTY
jgi:hypothetical protein